MEVAGQILRDAPRPVRVQEPVRVDSVISLDTLRTVDRPRVDRPTILESSRKTRQPQQDPGRARFTARVLGDQTQRFEAHTVGVGSEARQSYLRAAKKLLEPQR